MTFNASFQLSFLILYLRLALTQAEEMFTDMGIRTVEQELEFENDSLLMYTKTPVYWSRLVSSKVWTAEQQELGKEIVLDFMMEALEGTIFAFSDGSCYPLPHPTRGSTVGFLLLQCSNGVVRHPRDLQCRSQHVVSVESSSLFHHSIYP